jgi:DedD protein
MATTSSNEAAEVRRRGRHRLIGAIVIAILLVVFVPMILDSEPQPKRDTPALEIPSKDTPMPTSAAGAKGTTADVAPAKAGQPPPAPKKAEPAPAAPKKPEKVAAAPAPKLEGFAVQVGAFKDEEKLQEARKKLAFAGVSHYVERHDTPTGPLNRLRAGPYPTREAAEKALAQVKAAQLDGQVVPLP